ncbi:MAG: hypothetical protein NZ955_02395 [Candidatus Bathyarchaeota archaeon]|nr:hypothetical protein [Candidatus Bathyarchaeota archaeon]
MPSLERYRVCSDEEVKRILSFLEERYGFPRHIFEGYKFLVRGRNSIWVFSGHPSILEMIPGIDAAGIRALHLSIRKALKPTTIFLQVFGRYATKNIVKLQNEEEAVAFMSGGSIARRYDVDDGFVIVKFGDDILGCGFYSDGVLKSKVPKTSRVKFEWFKE